MKRAVSFRSQYKTEQLMPFRLFICLFYFLALHHRLHRSSVNHFKITKKSRNIFSLLFHFSWLNRQLVMFTIKFIILTYYTGRWILLVRKADPPDDIHTLLKYNNKNSFIFSWNIWEKKIFISFFVKCHRIKDRMIFEQIKIDFIVVVQM